jgi:hypothetical protein
MDELLQDATKHKADSVFQSNLDFEPDPLRPWHGLDSNPEQRQKDIKDWRHRPEIEESVAETIGVWYSSITGVVQAFLKHRIKLLVIFVLSTTLTTSIASFIPSTYFSTLHLYAPEKTDSVASRLQLFSNKIEYASFPVDFKIPLGLIARRLKSLEAKAWVLKKYAEMPTHASEKKIDPELVNAETFYAEGSELLVVQGYANDPFVSVDVTNLYWDYLENEIKSLHEDNLAKVQKWIVLTSDDWTQRLNSISKRLTNMPTTGYQENNGQLRTQLTSDYSSFEIKKRKINKEKAELQTALKSKDLSLVWAISDPEIQDIRRVDEAISAEYGTQNSHEALIARGMEILHRRIQEKDLELVSIEEQMNQVKQQMVERASVSRMESSISSKQSDLIRQQSDYVGRLEELEKLKNQIEVESTLAHKKLSPIQAAFADPTSLRPSMVVKYFICVFAAIFFTLIALILLESEFACKIRKSMR